MARSYTSHLKKIPAGKARGRSLTVKLNPMSSLYTKDIYYLLSKTFLYSEQTHRFNRYDKTQHKYNNFQRIAEGGGGRLQLIVGSFQRYSIN